MLGWLIGFIIIITLIIIADLTINDFENDFISKEDYENFIKKNDNEIIINLEKIIRKGQ